MFIRGDDPLAIAKGSPAVRVRAERICRRAVMCSARDEGQPGTCDGCARQASAELKRERDLREATKRRGQYLPGDRIR